MKIITRLFMGLVVGVQSLFIAFLILTAFLLFAFVILCFPIAFVGMFFDFPKPSSESIDFALKFVYLSVGSISYWNSFFCVLFDKKNSLHRFLTFDVDDS